MRFSYEASKVFIGQERIIKELAIIAEEVKEGANLNMLFEAPSGYGKNLLAYLFLAYVDPAYKRSIQYIPDKKGQVYFDTSRRFHYIDEAHLLSPQEQIYPYLSSADFTIILGTNNFDEIEEAVLTRVTRFQFSEYSEEEVALIMQLALEEHNVKLPFTLCKELAPYCRGVPRLVKNYAQRLSFIFKHTEVPTSAEDIHALMREYLGAEDGGFTEFDLQYLRALDLNGGFAGLDTLRSITGFSKKTIIEDIEPFLIRKRRIIKTPRGRKLCRN